MEKTDDALLAPYIEPIKFQAAMSVRLTTLVWWSIWVLEPFLKKVFISGRIEKSKVESGAILLKWSLDLLRKGWLLLDGEVLWNSHSIYINLR